MSDLTQQTEENGAESIQAAVESEKKYLLPSVPKELDLSIFPSVEIEQAYLPFGVSVMLIRDSGTLVQSISRNGEVLANVDMTDTADRFESLWEAAIQDGEFARLLPENPTVRIRRKGNKLLQTFKWALPEEELEEGTKSRTEVEFPITQAQYDTLSQAVVGNIIKKTRYTLAEGNFEVILDVFKGELDKLVLVEIEKKGDLDFDRLIMPDWFNSLATNVSNDLRFTNAALSSVFGYEIGALILKATLESGGRELINLMQQSDSGNK